MMNRKFYFYTSLAGKALVAMSIMLTACKSAVIPPKPAESYNHAEFKPDLSVINIPIAIPVAEIEKQLNAQVAGTIFEDKDLEPDNLAIQVSKRDKIKIEAKSNYFNFTVPLHIWAKAGWKTEQFGMTFAKYEETDFAINVKFATKLTIDNNWNVTTHTSSNGFEWVSKPVLKIGMFSIPLSSIIGDIIDKQLGNVAKQIDQQVKSKVAIKKQVLDAWKTLQAPMLVSQPYNTWVKVTPVELLMTPLEGKGEHVRSMIGLKGYAETFIGYKPQVTISNTLPLLQTVPDVIDDFEIGLVGQIPFTEAKRLAAEQMVGKVFTFQKGKRKVEVTEIDLYGKDEKLVVAVGLKGSMNGKVYLTGKPVYDPTTASVVMQQLDYDLQTKNKLLKTADWLAHGQFVQAMTPYFKFPLGNQINDAKQMIQASLNKNKITPNVTLNGSLLDLSPGDIYITPDAIKAVVKAKGKMEVLVDGL